MVTVCLNSVELPYILMKERRIAADGLVGLRNRQIHIKLGFIEGSIVY